ncbi:hypothetical protein ACFRJ1_05240 [Streptomyces sp. NPDC056773]|uniref:hypothetical protein n=1 Tax=unclassified Streptomyces TaxID=2593676 RepID=UPI003692DD07
MELTAEELVAEFQDAVIELYFARKRIARLEAENSALRTRLQAEAEEVGATQAAAPLTAGRQPLH